MSLLTNDASLQSAAGGERFSTAPAALRHRLEAFRSDRQPATRTPSFAQWSRSLRLACDWLIKRSTITETALPAEQNGHGYPYADWSGCTREYDASRRKWSVFAPLWHTGQAVKALVMAHSVLGDDDLLAAANHSAQFILRAQIRRPGHVDDGLILAFENGDPVRSWTSCMLESLDGLISLGHATGNEAYFDAALLASRWAQRRVWVPNESLLIDEYDPATSTPRVSIWSREFGVVGRPLIDDGVFLTMGEYGNDEELIDLFLALAERLLADEYPSGNWLGFPPCHPNRGLIHPRHAYWWGRPMIMAWQKTGDDRFLACARRCADWYVRAQRRDGGMFRETDLDFRTSTFGHATSGVLSAASLWSDLIQLGDEQYKAPCLSALRFGFTMQMVETSDMNLHGSIVEKVVLLDGSDRPPFLVRDLGSIFYIQALVKAMQAGLIGDGACEAATTEKAASTY